MARTSIADLERQLGAERDKQATITKALVTQDCLASRATDVTARFTQDELTRAGLVAAFAKKDPLERRHLLDLQRDKSLQQLHASDVRARELQQALSTARAAVLSGMAGATVTVPRPVTVAAEVEKPVATASAEERRSEGYPGWLVGGLLIALLLVSARQQSGAVADGNWVPIVALVVAIIAVVPHYADLVWKARDRRLARKSVHVDAPGSSPPSVSSKGATRTGVNKAPPSDV